MISQSFAMCISYKENIMSTIKDLDRLLELFVDQGIPGAALSVCKGEETLYEGYCGYQDLAHTKAMSADTIFRNHSITKAYSALCGMMQFERGAFLMDDPVSKYLPEFEHLKLSVRQPDGTWTVEDSKQPMLMRHAFNMNVGFYAFDGCPTATGLADIHERLGGCKFLGKYSLRDEIRALAEVPMLFEPGTHFQYGYGINIMAAVVEETSGMSLGEYMQKNLFEPLGMENSGFRFRPGWKDRLAECVVRTPDGAVVHCDNILGDPLDTMYGADSLYEAADAGILSSLKDLQTFAALLANEGTLKGRHIIGRKTLQMMRQNLLTDQMMQEFVSTIPAVDGYGYGYGVRTLTERGATLCNGSVGEYGWSGVAGAWMMADPTEKLSVAFMMQEMEPDYDFFEGRIRAVVNGLL